MSMDGEVLIPSNTYFHSGETFHLFRKSFSCMKDSGAAFEKFTRFPIVGTDSFSGQPPLTVYLVSVFQNGNDLLAQFIYADRSQYVQEKGDSIALGCDGVPFEEMFAGWEEIDYPDVINARSAGIILGPLQALPPAPRNSSST